ncbi:MAG: Asp-tRNA(Asn)/Glu-tRNA(Gln) amidotransferase subunit GatB [Actinomycetota bacterium]
MKTDGLVTTIGLEMHVELATRTKMFCGCLVAFGGEPNTRVCPVCLGLPGSLPVPNQRAVAFVTKIARALSCQIAPSSVFHRKNYFYPDMPKNYQISQYDLPLGVAGHLDVDVDRETRRIGITRVHLEEDTGKSIHVGVGGRIHEAEYSLEDFNRAGTPLVEIVTEPDLRSADEARIFAQELRSILEYLAVSDVRMEEGSLRFDANISVAASGERGTKVEVKNMNSLRSLHRALAYEEQRQGAAVADGVALEQSTRHWDEKAQVTKPLRTKEYAFDYRYFPEPDLVPMEPGADWLGDVEAELPELPSIRRTRLGAELGLRPADAAVITSSRAVADFYEAAVAAAQHADARQVANWVVNELLGALSDRGEDVASGLVSPATLAALVDLVVEGAISGNQGKEVLVQMLASGRAPGEIVDELRIRQVSDRSELERAVDEAIAANPDVAEKIRGGEAKPIGFLVGQVMRATGGTANPAVVNELIRERLGA